MGSSVARKQAQGSASVVGCGIAYSSAIPLFYLLVTLLTRATGLDLIPFAAQRQPQLILRQTARSSLPTRTLVMAWR